MTRQRMGGLQALVTLGAMVSCACSSADGGSSQSGSTSCTPAEAIVCACPDGTTGTQLCLDDGSYSPCDCGGIGSTPGPQPAGSSPGSAPPGPAATATGDPPPTQPSDAGPPEPACSLENPTGPCADASEQCVDGVCTPRCSPEAPEGYCEAPDVCEAGECVPPPECPNYRCTDADCDQIIELPGSTDPYSAQAREDGYYIAHPRYRYLRKDLTLLLAYAACEVQVQYPGTPPLGVADLSQADGKTPGTDRGSLRHSSSTHRGNDLDLAYYQTDGLNDPQIICGDGSDDNGNRCCGTYNDGDFCTTEENIVDWEPQVYFFVKMAVVEEDRIFGIDQTLDDDFQFWLNELVDQGVVTQRAAADVNLGYGASGGWQYHHHHVHLSFCRIGYSGGGCPRPDYAGMEPIVPPWDPPEPVLLRLPEEPVRLWEPRDTALEVPFAELSAGSWTLR